MIPCYLSLPDLILNRKGRRGRRRGTQRISSAYLCDVLCVPLRLNLLAKEIRREKRGVGYAWYMSPFHSNYVSAEDVDKLKLVGHLRVLHGAHQLR
jgi:hypothetical protein